ncbi:unnamed protein product, partial [Ectocarpus sp. 8 AP-2014]
STYVSAGASAGEVEAALEGLEPTGDLTVTRSENDDNGYDWQVTFETPVGDRGALVLDDAYLWSTNDDAEASILDGDNEVEESTGALICSDCQVGEAPVGYGYADLTQDELTYTISGLSPGVSYTVYVSAFNRHGQGARAVVDSGVVTPPLAVPSAPTNVSVAT